jgi:hypothetical protein
MVLEKDTSLCSVWLLDRCTVMNHIQYLVHVYGTLHFTLSSPILTCASSNRSSLTASSFCRWYMTVGSSKEASVSLTERTISACVSLAVRSASTGAALLLSAILRLTYMGAPKRTARLMASLGRASTSTSSSVPSLMVRP